MKRERKNGADDLISFDKRICFRFDKRCCVDFRKLIGIYEIEIDIGHICSYFALIKFARISYMESQNESQDLKSQTEKKFN